VSCRLKKITVTYAWLSFWYQSLTVNMVLVLVEENLKKYNRDRCLVVVLVSKFDREYGPRFGRRKFEKRTTVTDAWLSF
jgi:hypothetical protein